MPNFGCAKIAHGRCYVALNIPHLKIEMGPRHPDGEGYAAIEGGRFAPTRLSTTSMAVMR